MELLQEVSALFEGMNTQQTMLMLCLLLVLLMLVALVRGDEFYAVMGSMLLCAVAVIKLVAWHIYNRTM